MDINAFVTPQTAKTPAQPGGQVQSGTQTGLFSGMGMSFLDLLFANPENMDGKDGKQAESPLSLLLSSTENTDGGLQTDQHFITPPPAPGSEPLRVEGDIDATDESAPLSVNEFLTLLRDAGIPVEDVPTHDLSAIPPETREKIAHILGHFLKAMPADQQKVNADMILSAPKDDLIVGADEGDAILMATGLSLSDFNRLIEDIMKGEQDSDTLILAALVNITAPDMRKDQIVIPRGGTATNTAKTAPAATGLTNSEETGEIDAQMNLMQNSAGEDANAQGEDGGFSRILKILEKAQANENGYRNNATLAGDKPQNTQSAGNSALQATQSGATAPGDSFMFSAGWDSAFPDGGDWARGHASSMSPLHITGTAQMTSLVSHGGHAGQPHPATQMVAASIAKNNNGETKSMTLKLDPPELGRVEVRMEFSKTDKTMKAVVIAEKPETFLMLQRDAHVLERALQNSGMEVADNSLSFQLSEDGSLFGQHSDGRGQNHSGGGAAENAGGDDEILMETTMDWQVDPDTGLMHYDVLV